MDDKGLHPNWKALASADIKWKVFVRAKDDERWRKRETREGSEMRKEMRKETEMMGGNEERRREREMRRNEIRKETEMRGGNERKRRNERGENEIRKETEMRGGNEMRRKAEMRGNEEEEREKSQISSALDGEEAQRFYEELLEGQSNDITALNDLSEQHCTKTITKAMKSKQNNDITEPNTISIQYCNRTIYNSMNSTQNNDTTALSDLSKWHCTKKMKSTQDNDETALNNLSNQNCTRTIYKAMKSAQHNDVAGLRSLLDAGLDVNIRDEFGWSLLMVAAYAGAKGTVGALLEARAMTGVRDTKGNTAIYLATTKGHKHIVEMLIAARKGRAAEDEEQGGVSIVEMDVREFFCDVCGKMVKEATEKQHKTSIVHQFNLGIGNQQTIYGIPPSNRGYQLLVSQGWDEERGLGPQKQGQKFPVKTVLKRDREGLGSEQKGTARVTHFGPADIEAVKRVGKPGERMERKSTLSKREMKRQKTKEKRKEMELRRELNDPDY